MNLRLSTLVVLFFIVFQQGQIMAQKIKTPGEFLPHQPGEKMTPHHLLIDYFDYLAAQSPRTMKLERYGATYEARPLQIAIFSSPENMARLEEIRTNNLKLAGMLPGTGKVEGMPAIVWLSMSVHGNEPAGSECSPELAYRLAMQTDATVAEWLRNTIVIVDPSLNPDGYDRYTHWNRMVSNMRLNVNPLSREHVEGWPTGRSNHYNFDLNRDWAWATQVESRQRLEVYHRWLPHVHADLHEQGYNDHYYFAPAAEPMHELLTPWQRDFQVEIGRNHAQYFDKNGWLYFTKEIFDLLYPSYGDTYPMMNGAIGMTYEQAGIRAGRAIKTNNGDTLRLTDRIEHHLTTSLSTIEISSKNAAKVVEQFGRYYSRMSQDAPGKYKTFVVKAENDPNKVNTLCRLLDLHRIRYGLAGATLNGVSGFDFATGKETNVSVNAGDLIISVYQPHGVMAAALFEPQPYLSDSLTYDITAWSLPFAHGLEACALKQRLEPKKPREPYVAPAMMLAAKPYAWCVHRKSLSDMAWVADLAGQGIQIRYAKQPFNLADQQFSAGALVVNRADNRSIDADLDRLVMAAARKHNVTLHPMFTGMVGKGRDMGSENFALIPHPEVALIYGEPADINAFGHLWHYFEQDLDMQVTLLHIDQIDRENLQEFNAVILPDGSYSFDDDKTELLKEWVQNGGKLIALEGATSMLAKPEWAILKSRPAPPKKDTAGIGYRPYMADERDRVSENLPGAIIKTKIDYTHPITFGLGAAYFTLKTGSTIYDLPSESQNAVWLGDQIENYGFIGSRLKPRLTKTPIAGAHSMGSGTVVYFVDSPIYRAFWQQGKLLLANAIFY